MPINRREFLAGAAASIAATANIKSADRAAEYPLGPAAEPTRWAEVRSQFDSLSRDVIHMSSFFLVSHPKPVRESIERHRKGIDNDPFTYVEENVYRMPAVIQGAAAAYLGGKPEEVAITNSTTTGLALVYQGLTLTPGDEILTTTHDHFVHHESIRLAAKRSGATVRKVALYDDISKVSVDDIIVRLRRSITTKTRVLGITWVHSSTGLKLPVNQIAGMVAELNRNRSTSERIVIVVDGVHGFGVEDESAAQMGVDFFAAGTHKWMFGPRGTGILWGKEESWKRLEMVIPAFTMETFGAWISGQELTAPMRASWINCGGFRAFENEWAMPAAFDFHKSIGRKAITDRIHELNRQCKEGLQKMRHIGLRTPMTSELSAGIIAFDVKGMKTDAAVSTLHSKRIIASSSPYSNPAVRVAPSLLNSSAEVDETLRRIAELT